MSPIYSKEPTNKTQFTAEFDHAYTQFASIYDFAVKALPVWKKWIKQALPHIQGPRVLEVSFGTGYLLTHYASKFETYGLEYNRRMACTARQNLEKEGLRAQLQVGDVEALPYPNGTFDSLVNTMAFTGYPEGTKAMSELWRVIKPGGRLILIDINYPSNRNRIGTTITRIFASLGDIIRDMDPIFQTFEIPYQDHEIGGFGSVHLYVAQKKERSRTGGPADRQPRVAWRSACPFNHSMIHQKRKNDIYNSSSTYISSDQELLQRFKKSDFR